MSFSENEIIEQLALTRGASTSLALATSEKKNEVLFSLAQLLLENSALIIAENEKDLATKKQIDALKDKIHDIIISNNDGSQLSNTQTSVSISVSYEILPSQKTSVTLSVSDFLSEDNYA